MSAHDPDITNAHNEGFTQGESFGRHVARQELLPLLKAVRALLRFDADPSTIIRAGGRGPALRDVEALVADIETT